MNGYDAVTGLPIDKSYLEKGLPDSLVECIVRMKQSWEKVDKGIEDMRWDCYYCELQSEINVYEVENVISSDVAWYLRETYLRMKKGYNG